MYKVRRAIILAAGKGTRMQPLTFETPKPLINVNGKIMIETIIEGLLNNNITEIYVVVGYLKDKFRYLLDKYPEIQFIYNPFYDEYNNISSLYVAKNYLENSIILDADQIIYNEKILSPEFEKSGYNCVWTEEDTKEWLLNLDENNNVISCSRNGGKNGWQLYSISRWNEEDGKKLREHLIQEFEYNKNYQIYWDDIALFCYPGEYELGIRKMNYNDILEIDSIEELKKIDKSYKFKELKK